jgi:hypothetical protein
VQRAAATANHEAEGVVAVEVAGGGDILAFDMAEARRGGVADRGAKAKRKSSCGNQMRWSHDAVEGDSYSKVVLAWRDERRAS